MSVLCNCFSVVCNWNFAYKQNEQQTHFGMQLNLEGTSWMRNTALNQIKICSSQCKLVDTWVNSVEFLTIDVPKKIRFSKLYVKENKES